MDAMTRTSPIIPLKPARPAAARPAPKLEPESSAAAGRLVTWLKMYWLTILFLGSLLGTGLAYLAWTMLPSKYESYAKFRVASSPFTVSNNRDPNRSRTDFTTYLKTTSQSIKNEFVLNKALSLEIDGVRISELPTLKDQKQPLQFLDDELNVSFSEGSELITLMMKGHHPEDLRRILNAVQQAFMEEVIEKELKRQQAHLQVVNSILVEAQKTLNERTQKIADPLVMPAVGVEAKQPIGVLTGNVTPAVATAQVGPPDWVKKQIAMNRVSRALSLQEQVNDLPVMIESQKARISFLKKQLEIPVPVIVPPTAIPVAPTPTRVQPRTSSLRELERTEHRRKAGASEREGRGSGTTASGAHRDVVSTADTGVNSHTSSSAAATADDSPQARRVRRGCSSVGRTRSTVRELETTTPRRAR
jgi:polysaccharide biosynthesis transport protein